MKKTIFSILFALVLLVPSGLVTATPALAATANLNPDSGTDTTSWSAHTLTATERGYLATSNDARYTSAGSWGDSYTDGEYINFGFPDISGGATVTSVSLSFEWQRASNRIDEARLRISGDGGSSWAGTHDLTMPTAGTDDTVTLDLLTLDSINTAGEVNSLLVQFQAAYSGYSGSRTTYHDLVQVDVTYATGPTITISGTPLSAFSSAPGVPSAEQFYTVSGSNLTDNITVTAPTDFEISTTSGSGFLSSLILPQAGGSVTDTTIYVRFNSATEGSSSGDITHTSSGATQQDVAVSGTATTPLEEWIAYNDCAWVSGQLDTNITTYTIPDDAGLLMDYTTGEDTPATVTFSSYNSPVLQTGDYAGSETAPGTDAYVTFHDFADMTGVIQYGSSGWWVDVTFTGLDPETTYTFATSANRDNSGYTNRYTIYTLSSVDAATNASTMGVNEINNLSVWFNTGDNHDEGFVARWTGIQPGSDGSFTVRAEAHPDAEDSGRKSYAFSVFVLQQESPAGPTITISGTPLSAFSSAPGVPSAEQFYTVSGSNLTADIVITAPTDFEISTTSGSGFLSSLILPQSGGTVASQTIYVRFNRATEGTSTDNITHTSSGATTKNVAVSGTASCNVTATFQEGASGYSGTVDTFIMESNPTNSYGGEDWAEWDNDDPSGQGKSNFGLIRFEDIFSSEGGPIPDGATIVSATLTYYVQNEGNEADVNEVAIDWAESVTYNGFGGTAGVQPADYGTSLGTTSGSSSTGSKTIDVTASLTVWSSDPSANHGWVFRPTDTNGVEFRSSEHATAGDRPLLTVTYSSCGPANQAPDQPVLVQPGDGATGVSTPPTLQVTVTDPDSDPMDVTFYGREVGTGTCEDFTVIALPDTQNYSDDNPDTYFIGQTQWIVDNHDTSNIVYVAHEGDIVNSAGDTNQWDRADAAMSLLENPATTGLTDGIPYGMVPGNHDEPTANYNLYFGVSRFSGRGYYGGHYGTTNDNNYTLFSASGMDFIVVNLEFQPGTAELNWADARLKEFSDRRAIVVSHYILNTDGSLGYPAIYNELQDNPNLFLMLCGHMHDEAQRTETGDYGNTIYILLADYQDEANGGNGYLRTMRFSPASDTIYVKTYSPTVPGYLTDGDSQFELTYDMDCSGSSAFALIGTDYGVTSGNNASLSWPGLAQNTEYEWYVDVSDGTATTTGPTWSFTTAQTDADGDGVPDATDNCPSVYNPGQEDLDLDDIGDACDDDADGDGYDAVAAGGTDCDDTNAAINPGATEACNGVDDDCDGLVDDDDPDVVDQATWYLDSDSDTFGDPAVSTQACDQPAGYVANNTDCDDSDDTVYPGATEACNGIDDDCDGTVDEGCPPLHEVWVGASFNDSTPGWGYDHFASIQAGIDAVEGSTVYVAAGTYYENITLIDGVEVLGEGASVTIIDGDGSGPVVTASGVGSGTKLDGFTIQNGSATNGGGMYNDNSLAVVSNCTFSNNTATNDGGGMYNQNTSSPTVTDCVFNNNSAVDGGGIHNQDSSSPQLTGCTFTGNEASDDGGGILNVSNSNPTVTNCTFTGNSAVSSGGGILNGSNSNPTVTNCTFSGNEATSGAGGGMYNVYNCSPTVSNCTFYGNSANLGGGGMCNWGEYSSPTVTNCTFYGNTATTNGGGMYNNIKSSPIVTNCILWNNGEEIFNEDVDSVPTVSYCDVQGGYGVPADNNINADPLFVAPGSGDFHLQPGSPCIDAGDNAAPSLPATDFEGDARIIDGDCDLSEIVDMGVDECPPTYTTYYRDDDDDGYGQDADSQYLCAPSDPYDTTVGGDCDDTDADEHPGQTWYKDADNDGHSDGTTDTTSCTRPAGYKVASELTATSGDCNDNDGNNYPGNTESCDGYDNDCDGLVDEEGATGCITYYLDADHDGFGLDSDSKCLCAATGDYTALVGGDCDDNDGNNFPGNTESCDGYDNDCDGLVDDADPSVVGQTTWYQDSDSDTFGNPSVSQLACSQPTGYVLDNTDCNDSDPNEHPGQTWYKDADDDGYSDGTTDTTCSRPAGYKVASELTATSGDCKDNDNTVHPGATEVCNGYDDDCDGLVDDADPSVVGQTTWYQDSDSDTFGNPSVSQLACSQPTGYVLDNTDCNDSDPNEHPGQTWYKDADNDLYSDGTSTTSCTRPTGYKVASELTATSGDCNDGNPDVNPAATEECNGIDDDCDTLVDEEGATGCTTYYRDDDNDGYGQDADSKCLCAFEDPYDTTVGGDCNDSDPNEHPGQTWYKDADDDLYSDGTSTTSCTRPTDYKVASELTATSGDCDDGDGNNFPGNTEVCGDGQDNDCDTLIDCADDDCPDCPECYMCNTTSGECEFDSSQLPAAGFTATPLSGCVPLTVQFTNNSTNTDSWLWDFGDGMTSTDWEPSHQYTNSSSGYTVTLTVTNSCGSDSYTDIITVYPIPNCTIAAPDALCEGSSATASVSASYAGSTYVWSVINNGSIIGSSSGTSITFQAGDYASGDHLVLQVEITTSHGCYCISSKGVDINENPDCTITLDANSADGAVCEGTSGLTAEVPYAGDGAVYNWYLTDNFVNASASGRFLSFDAGDVTGNGIIHVKVDITTAEGCFCESEELDIIVGDTPDCDITLSDDSVCENSTGLTASVAEITNATYAWTLTGDYSNLSGADTDNITFDVGAAGTVNVQVEITTVEGCYCTSNEDITVNPYPVADAGIDQTIATGGSTTIGGSSTASGGSGSYTYSWSPTDDLNDPSSANPVASPTATVTYTVTVTDSNGCTDTDSMTLTVTIPPPVGGSSAAPERCFLIVEMLGERTLVEIDCCSNTTIGECQAYDENDEHLLELQGDTLVSCGDCEGCNCSPRIIVMSPSEETPEIPEGMTLVGDIYDFTGYKDTAKTMPCELGTYFDPSASVLLHYDPALLDGASDPVIGFYSHELGQWIILPPNPGIVAEVGVATGLADHFASPCAVLASVPPPATPEPPAPNPAHFVASSLNIVPFEVKTEETVTISLNVTNDGEVTGTYTAELKINGDVVDSKAVTLEGGQSEPVSFAVSASEAGTYEVTVSSLSGSFTVVKSSIWWIYLIIAAVVIIGGVLALRFRKKTSR